MKIFQILNGFCHYDATPIHPTLADTVDKYAPDIIFVEAPDYVFEGWGYDETQKGDARFIKPTPPDGWLYDDTTGCFKEINQSKDDSPSVSTEEEIKALRSQIAALQEQLNNLESQKS